MVIGIVNGRGRYSPVRSVRFAVTQEKTSQRRAGSPLWHRDVRCLMQPDDMLETFSELAVIPSGIRRNRFQDIFQCVDQFGMQILRDDTTGPLWPGQLNNLFVLAFADGHRLGESTYW